MNLPTLIDVALGLSLVFFLLASIGSVLAELWAAHRKLRHRLLRDTVNRLLGPDIAKHFWEHSLILPLYAPPPSDDDDEEEAKPARVDDDPIAKAKHYVAATFAKTRDLTVSARRWLTSGRKAEAPAYLKAELFATVVLDIASGRGALGAIPNDRSAWDATIRANIAEIMGDANDLEDHLLALLRQLHADTPDVATALKAAVAKWYEEAMQRASGTYRRSTQKALLVIGATLAVALNVDTVRIAQILYLNPQLRTAVAAQANAVVEDEKAAAAAAATPATEAARPTAPAAPAAPAAPDAPAAPAAPATPAPSGSEPTAAPAAPATKVDTDAPPTPREQLRASVADLRDLAKIGFPLGWTDPFAESFLFRKKSHSGDNEPAALTPASWLAKLLGVAASALAVCLGAPFWFDVMGRLVKLRSSAGAAAEKDKSAAAATTATDTATAPDSPTAGLGATSASPPAPAPAPARPLPTALVALARTAPPGFDPARAYWLAEFADHAYETNATLLTTWLGQHGFQLKKAFNDAATDTQGFLAVAGDVAVLAFRGTEKKLGDWLTDAQAEQIADPA